MLVAVGPLEGRRIAGGGIQHHDLGTCHRTSSAEVVVELLRRCRVRRSLAALAMTRLRLRPSSVRPCPRAPADAAPARSRGAPSRLQLASIPGPVRRRAEWTTRPARAA